MVTRKFLDQENYSMVKVDETSLETRLNHYEIVNDQIQSDLNEFLFDDFHSNRLTKVEKDTHDRRERKLFLFTESLDFG